MKKDELVTIIIANYNGARYLNTCIRSVLKSKYENFELLITDDGSTDRSVIIINNYIKRDGRISLYRNKVNVGAAASRNIAIRKAKGEILIFLDNDTEVHPFWINELLKTFKTEKSIGAVQSILLDFNRRDKVQMAGGLLIPYTAWLLPFDQWKSYKEIRKKFFERDIVAISAALAVKKRVIEAVGGFDELEAVTTEDLDFCWRIWIAGYKIKLSPRSVVFHWTKKVQDRDYIGGFERIYYHLAKNSFRSMIKNYEFYNLIRYLPISVLLNIGRGFYVLLRDGSSSALLGTWRALLWNVNFLVDASRARRIIQQKRKYFDAKIMKQVFSNENILSINKKFLNK